VGAGIGFALNKTGEVELSSSLAPGAPTTLPGGSNTEFAWQAMAGVSVGLTRTMTLELGYRYVDLGAIEFDQGNQIQFGLPAGTTLGMNGNLSAHEVIASIRLGI
jgi:opacity protein-like surface antigen